ncbi:Biofilm dispersion protein BdlA [Methylobrevis pamukkalensis]|uniref:Biofilm dispersion protein BdlA n=1 Tax=Methylobrevis pamukkalensis TaxID=1439726 RepID=A0A1E3HA28_9HYPH|nr:Biofilm dispersion protein BdlA [Methylobrevis pamukkalensis]
MTPEDRDSAVYREFWKKLERGEVHVGAFKRITKDGRHVWIEATYNPVFGRGGRTIKVVKLATDITQRKLAALESAGQIAAINRAQAVIHFTLDGTVTEANQNFLDALGYRIEEIRGQHHRMFMEPGERDSAEYRRFWDDLRRGEFQSAECKRIGKGGREVWIQATYNPILDDAGRPLKVVKFATDITAQVEDRRRRHRLQGVMIDELAEVAKAISETSRQATDAATASAETSSNVQAVASGAEELVASVEEISRQVGQALVISTGAVRQAQDTTGVVASLASAAQKIGDVVALINSIAAQTNLLALNATIEAARAARPARASRWLPAR